MLIELTIRTDLVNGALEVSKPGVNFVVQSFGGRQKCKLRFCQAVN
jgi:hypothetical protein